MSTRSTRRPSDSGCCSPVDDPASDPSVGGALVDRGRAVAVDLGDRRIGIAVSDSRRVLAHPATVIARSGDAARDHQAIAAIVEEYGATVVVVGLPLSLSGRAGPAAVKVTAETEALRVAVPVPILLHDERLSTVEATRRLREASTAATRRPSTKRRAVVDDLAATVILQSWIDAGAPTGTA